jgi:hypothetical protein
MNIEELMLKKLTLEIELVQLQIIKTRNDLEADEMFRQFYDAKERALRGLPGQLGRFLEIGEQLCERGEEYAAVAAPEIKKVQRRVERKVTDE